MTNIFLLSKGIPFQLTYKENKQWEFYMIFQHNKLLDICIQITKMENKTLKTDLTLGNEYWIEFWGV